jgi:hypothetical protein
MTISPWNKSRIIGQKRPFQLPHIWSNGSDLPESFSDWLRQGRISAGIPEKWFTGQNMRSIQEVTVSARWVPEA